MDVLFDSLQSFLRHSEAELVLEAIRRSSDTLSGMSAQEIGEYLRNLNPEQLQGLVNNVKGIYHELAFVEKHNIEGSDTVAAVFSDTNHPGADVYFMDGGDVVSEVQLKATESVEHIQEHFDMYPDIEVLATDEVASVLEGVESSGFSNLELTTDVNETLQAMMDSPTLEQSWGAIGEWAGGFDSIDAMTESFDSIGAMTDGGDAISEVIAGIFELFNW